VKAYMYACVGNEPKGAMFPAEYYTGGV
jgi:hypothetical protein